jgi:hypothetical protein
MRRLHLVGAIVLLVTAPPPPALAQQSTPTLSAPSQGVAPSYPGSGHSRGSVRHRPSSGLRLENPEAALQRCAQLSDRADRESCERDARRNATRSGPPLLREEPPRKPSRREQILNPNR